MKHCPNPACPFLHQYKMVAEFRDEIEICPDCGTPLAPGEAPEIESVEEEFAAEPYEPMFPENREPDLVTLCTVESEADAEFYRVQLELQGIPATIVIADDEIEDDEIENDEMASEEVQEEVAELEAESEPENAGLYDVQVLRSDLLRATHFLDTLETDETAAEEGDEEAEDEEDNDRPTANPNWSDATDDEPAPSTAPTLVTPDVAPSASHEVSEKTPSRSSQMLLMLVVIVVVILIVLFLLNQFGK